MFAGIHSHGWYLGGRQSPGKDHITGVVTPIGRGLKYRFQIEKGVLRLLAKAQKLKGK